MPPIGSVNLEVYEQVPGDDSFIEVPKDKILDKLVERKPLYSMQSNYSQTVEELKPNQLENVLVDYYNCKSSSLKKTSCSKSCPSKDKATKVDETEKAIASSADDKNNEKSNSKTIDDLFEDNGNIVKVDTTDPFWEDF